MIKKSCLEEVVKYLSIMIRNYQHFVDNGYNRLDEWGFIKPNYLTVENAHFNASKGICYNAFQGIKGMNVDTNGYLYKLVAEWQKSVGCDQYLISFFVGGGDEYNKSLNLWLHPKRLHAIIFLRNKILDAINNFEELNNAN